jgi:hypothetical protein
MLSAMAIFVRHPTHPRSMTKRIVQWRPPGRVHHNERGNHWKNYNS